MTDQARLTWAVMLSMLLHGLVLSLPLGRWADRGISAPPALLDVDLVQLPKPQPLPPPAVEPAPAPAAPPALLRQRQIVSLPDAGQEKEPEKTRLLSDRDNTVEQEMIHRGEPAAGDGGAKPAPPAQHAASAASEPAAAAQKARPERGAGGTRVTALPGLDELLPRAGALTDEAFSAPAPAPETAPPVQASASRSDLLRHGDPWRSRSLGSGSLDFLPQVREGDITLLNTKAELFAPFVRRVAMRVFENFVILLRRGADNGQAAEEFAAVEAVMDTRGRLMAIHAADRSVSAGLATDRNLRAACHEGFFDRNPPPGAESSDGNIHFVFDARVLMGLDQTGRRVPAWALLGAGLL